MSRVCSFGATSRDVSLISRVTDRGWRNITEPRALYYVIKYVSLHCQVDIIREIWRPEVKPRLRAASTSGKA